MLFDVKPNWVTSNVPHTNPGLSLGEMLTVQDLGAVVRLGLAVIATVPDAAL